MSNKLHVFSLAGSFGVALQGLPVPDLIYLESEDYILNVVSWLKYQSRS